MPRRPWRDYPASRDGAAGFETVVGVVPVMFKPFVSPFSPPRQDTISRTPAPPPTPGQNPVVPMTAAAAEGPFGRRSAGVRRRWAAAMSARCPGTPRWPKRAPRSSRAGEGGPGLGVGVVWISSAMPVPGSSMWPPGTVAIRRVRGTAVGVSRDWQHRGALLCCPACQWGRRRAGYRNTRILIRPLDRGSRPSDNLQRPSARRRPPRGLWAAVLCRLGGPERRDAAAGCPREGGRGGRGGQEPSRSPTVQGLGGPRRCAAFGLGRPPRPLSCHAATSARTPSPRE